jgi:hypothetical protein
MYIFDRMIQKRLQEEKERKKEMGILASGDSP